MKRGKRERESLFGSFIFFFWWVPYVSERGAPIYFFSFVVLVPHVRERERVRYVYFFFLVDRACKGHSPSAS